MDSFVASKKAHDVDENNRFKRAKKNIKAYKVNKNLQLSIREDEFMRGCSENNRDASDISSQASIKNEQEKRQRRRMKIYCVPSD